MVDVLCNRLNPERFVGGHAVIVLLVLGHFLFGALIEVLIRVPVVQRELMVLLRTIMFALDYWRLNVHVVNSFR